MSTLTFSPGGQEERNLNLQAGLDRGGLGASGAAVTLQAGLGVGDDELDRSRQLNVERVAVVHGDRCHLLLEQVVLCLADGLVRDRQLVIGAGVR